MHKHLEEYDDELLKLEFEVSRKEDFSVRLIGHGVPVEDGYEYDHVECVGGHIGSLKLTLEQVEDAIGRDAIELVETQLTDRFN